jgi:outer membrane protein OmpA-like peptidoglycan-associated protein
MLRRTSRFMFLLLFAVPAIAQTGGPTSDVTAQLLGPGDLGSGPADTATLTPTAVRLAGINSAARDDTPIITADSRLMFFNSTRYADRTWARTVQGRYDDDIYVATSAPGQTEGWRQPENLRAVNTSDDDGIVAIGTGGLRLYYLSLRRGWRDDGGPFYQADRRGTEVARVVGMGGGITQFFASVPQKSNIRIFGASISADALSFYFATTAFSRTGDHEIWVSRRVSADSAWGAPENLGRLVNAGGGSYAPFIAADGKTLYFASGRPGGLGGDDIYMTVLKDGTWRQPINVGAPINSPADDAFLSLPASGDKVYFSSTRSGEGDLFVAPMRPELRPSNVALLSTFIVDSLSNAPIEATISIEDLATGTSVFHATTSSLDGRVAAVLHPGGRYVVSITAPGYVFQTERLDIPNDTTFAELERTFRLSRPDPNAKIRLRTIDFDYSSAILRPESFPELDRLVAFLRSDPDVRIAVDGHTDSIGTEQFNLQLSLDRAAAVRQYLISNGGVDASRIVIEGFGASRPVAPNSDEEGRELNRRVEFVILGRSETSTR